ncbi:MAG: trypsin-like peptidase domain-containing protein [Phycisphaerales bacterium JB063]
MKLHCKVVSGYQAGLDRELDRDTVRISRDEKADIQLHPTKDLQVGSQQHVELVRDGDGYIVRCLHANGVTVITGGKTVKLAQSDQTRFTQDADLVIGKDGPRIRCITIDSEIPATVTQLTAGAREQMPVSEVTSGTVQKAEQSSHRILIVGGVALFLVLAVGLGSYFAFRSAGKKADDTISALEDEIDEQAEEHERDLEKLNRAMDASIAEMTTMRESIEEIDAEVRRDFASVLRGYTHSVASVGIMDTNGLFSPQGTAWIVGTTQLATNAHVAEGLRDTFDQYGGADQGIKIVARFAGAEAREIEIEPDTMKIHPGYAYFEEVVSSHYVDQLTGSIARLSPGGNLEPFHLGSSYDVAVLTTTTPAGTPLPLAKEDELRGLDQGTEIAYIGFPLEGLAGARINNPPEMHIGRLTSLTNLVYESDTFENSLILNHSLPIVGGSSGSPIFSKDGKVIGLISHGAMAFVNTQSGVGTRIVFGFNYGQRVTMLRDLLAEHPGKDAQRLREEQIQRELDSLNLADATNRALFRSIYAARNTLHTVKENNLVTGSAELNFNDREVNLDVWPSENEVLTLNTELKPGNYIVSAATSARLDIILAVATGDTLAGRSDNTGLHSSEAVFFNVPGEAGGPAVQCEIAIGRAGETETEPDISLIIFPLQ